jgi:protein TonB
VELSDVGVIAPVPLVTPPLQYPPIALARRVEGKVEISILVDERGGVADAKLVTGAGGRTGLNEAAIANARRRRYRPASKDGVPVKVWVPVSVNFVLPD